MKYHHALRFLIGGYLSASLVFHGVPQVVAFAQPSAPPFPRPRHARTALKQSSRSLFSRSESFPRDEKQFQDVREAQKERQRSLAKEESDRRRNKNSVSIPMMENNINLLQNPAVSGLDIAKVTSVTATSLLAVLTLYALLKTGHLMALFRHTSWWMEYTFTSYKNLLVNHPLITKVGTGAVLAVLGDALAQSLTNGGTPYDKRRAVSFAAFDSCYRVFQHHMFPAVIAFCQGNVLARLGIMPALGAAMERTMVYQLLVVPVSCVVSTISPRRFCQQWISLASLTTIFCCSLVFTVDLLSRFFCFYRLHPGSQLPTID
jgi:hypothetical protein